MNSYSLDTRLGERKKIKIKDISETEVVVSALKGVVIGKTRII